MFFIRLLALSFVFLAGTCTLAADNDPPKWVEAMKKVHEGFTGAQGYVAQFGDSITYTMAFWKPLSWSDPTPYLKDDDLPRQPEKPWKNIIQGADDKGPDAANYSGWRVTDLLKAVPKALERNKPEAALIMIGTNDISSGKVPADYEPSLEKVIQLCIDAKCIPILSTIPPKRGQQEAVEAVNKIIKAQAEKHNLPLIDFYSEILIRAPQGKWDGTLISKDGVHPTGGESQNYTEENLKKSGYALRNWVSFLKYREVYFKVLTAK
jgi:GDSL-like Lipase/Acylhydrolase family